MKIQRPTRLFWRVIAPATAVFAFTGCVSAKYKMAPKDTPPALALNLTAISFPGKVEAPPSTPVELTLNAVIVFQGPGSWKRAAYWDEYVLTLANHGPTPITFESALLTDFQNRSTAPGDDPWKLEKESRSYEKRLASTAGNLLKIGGGAVASTAGGILGGAAVGTIVGGGATGGFIIIPSWVAGAVVGAVVAVPVYASATIYRNISSKHQVEAGFARRSLALPVTLAPGQVVQGSFFFSISPGPQRLVLHGRSGDEPRDLVIDLTPLAGLHLQSVAATPASFPSSQLPP